MSTLVESGCGAGAADVSRMNGHGTHNGHHESNGDSDKHLFQPPPLRIRDRKRAQKIESYLSGLVLTRATLRRVARVFAEELERGLREEPSSLQMENTYVPELPNGTEEGVFLALDLGGTNFRVLLIELRAGQLVREDVQQYHINDALRLGPGEDLFNFLADCVQDFLRAEGMEDQELSLGFTFSFPMKHHSISSGELITWTKSFNCSGMAGADLAGMLQASLLNRGLRVRVQVLLNDTTGTLVAGAQRDPDVGIAVIMGTGSNGCYMERASRVQHWEAARRPAEGGDVCVDVEWGAFGDNHCLDFIKTPFDRTVDDNSLLVNSFTFEKYIGGKYLGSLLCAALAGLAQAGLLPAGTGDRLRGEGEGLHVLETAHLSLFEKESMSGGTAQTAATLREACGGEWGEEGARLAQHVARLLSTRAAQLAAVCVSELLKRMSRSHVTVAVDGSVYKKHPRISTMLRDYIATFAPNHKFTIMEAEDGSGKGSALTAAIAARLANK